MADNYAVIDGKRYEIEDMYDIDTVDGDDEWNYAHLSLAVKYRPEDED